MAQQAFDPGTIYAEESHSCGAYHPCNGRGVLTVEQVIVAIQISSDGEGSVDEDDLRKHLGLPPKSIPVTGVHVGPFSQGIRENPAA